MLFNLAGEDDSRSVLVSQKLHIPILLELQIGVLNADKGELF